MRRFTDAGRKSIAEKNWYVVLSLALTIPDICGSLEDPGTGKTAKRYVNWCRKWIEPRVTGGRDKSHVFLSGEDCFQLRCSLIHSGSSEIAVHQQRVLQRIEFFESGPHMNLYRGNILNGVPQPNFLQLRADLFAGMMFDAADEWDISIKSDPKVQAEKAKLLVIHPPGTAIGGIRFG